ncbi:AraC family transcriptional regulator [Psychrobacter glaciei]|uniref:AraC family transcriptional regulator n=2 Tax=Psychrobacter glaciei TaxID=619771 RepID=UPI001F06B179|nr:AraC family transcriptional regulator [Psychrobacter glaciei]MCH1781953.1 AraC family transcriptional regulator [Psychrobacter glaciei]
MDILSRLFDEMHLQKVQYITVKARGSWQLVQSRQDYLTFIVVISGEVHLCYGNDNNDRQVITANNMMMLTTQGSYACQSAPTVSKITAKTIMPAHTEGQIGLEIDNTNSGHKVIAQTNNAQSNHAQSNHAQSNHVQDNEAQFIVVRSQFDADMARPLLSALPASLPPVTQKHSAYNDVVHIGLQFFLLEVSLQRPGKTTMLERLAGMLMIECIREYVEQLEMASGSKDSITHTTDNTLDRTPSWIGHPWQIDDDADHSSENNATSNRNENGNWLAALKDPCLSNTLYLMHRYPEDAWTLQGLAKASGLSRSGLNERFKQSVGITPLAYLSHYRLRLAARFLRQEQYSISKISELVGYASDHSFSGAFKRRYGQSPSHYRKAHSRKSKP